MENKISEHTRKNIFDFMQVNNFSWSGGLEEVDFLRRIFDLHEMVSLDSRFDNAAEDIWQHRVNNPNDWPDDWIFSDTRFNLLGCDDSTFLAFLSETVHPIVRQNRSEIAKMVELYNENLKKDGFEIVEKSSISHKPIFGGKMTFTGKESLIKKGNELKLILTTEYVSQQVDLMESSVETNPHLSIGIAKELIETTRKAIIERRNESYDKNWDLGRLTKETTRLLKITSTNISDETKAAKPLKKIISSLSSLIQGIAEVRNEYGSGHGRGIRFNGLQPRHAKLAVGAASTLAIYLLETDQSNR